MSTLSYEIHADAYYKVFFHAAKHPHNPVNGILLGTRSKESKVNITDAIPLLHHWTSLSPMMEIGLDLGFQYAESAGLSVVGYYQASDRLDDAALVPVGEKVASKVRDKFQDAVAFVIDGEKLGSGEAALIPFTWQSSSWKPVEGSPAPFTPGSKFQLSSPDLATKAISCVKDKHLHHAFGDFDDHLEDVTIDWLRNRACLP